MISKIKLQYLKNSLKIRGFKKTTIKNEEIEVFINGCSVKVEKGSALIQACEKAGVDIPRFCYHERLGVAGNCRMCLVEVERSPKPVASCAFPIMPGMKVFTDTPMVKKAREGVMEFLLANHPLDCPICDQGGECDLQDQSIRYGSDRTRFFEPIGKRAVENKNLGPLIKTVMTRCIHCTRCVRFANEIAGVDELGTTGRGNDMQIGTYIEKTIDSELSGNIIDLCPVGALTSKPYSFSTRPWELKRTETIDVMDALGCNIRIDSRGLEVMRVLPRLNEDINEEWISDKTRFSYDGLKTQRLTHPLILENGRFLPLTWPDALTIISDKINNTNSKQLKAIVGQLTDAESMVALKDFYTKLGSNKVVYENSYNKINLKYRASYLLNTGIANFEKVDFLLLIGTNPKKEAPILNARIRKAYLYNNLNVALIGEQCDLTYEYEHLGNDSSCIDSLMNSEHFISKLFSEAKHPAILIGSSVYEHEQGDKIMSNIAKLALKYKTNLFCNNWNGFNVLHKDAARVASLDIKLMYNELNEDIKFIYLLNADEIKEVPKDCFVVYQGHHGDMGAQYANIVLPGLAFTEKSATYVNTEGRTQLTKASVSAPGSAREDWKIIRALSEINKNTLPYDNIYSLRLRMSEINPSLINYDQIYTNEVDSETFLKSMIIDNDQVNIELRSNVTNFYLTNCIARASKTMAKCTAAFIHNEDVQDPKQEAFY